MNLTNVFAEEVLIVIYKKIQNLKESFSLLIFLKLKGIECHRDEKEKIIFI